MLESGSDYGIRLTCSASNFLKAFLVASSGLEALLQGGAVAKHVRRAYS